MGKIRNMICCYQDRVFIVVRRARQRKEDILANSHPSHVSDALDAELRSRFRILL
jgi:hypothetical protein